LTQQLRVQPTGIAGRQFAHGAEGCDVGIFPGATAQKAGQYVSDAEQQQGKPGQAADCRLGNDGWRGLVQGMSGVQKKECPILGQKKAA